ncbi:MAG: hypothetical protein ABR925_00335 [Acidimicrobiales bacterium]
MRTLAAVSRVVGRHAIPIAGAIALFGAYMGGSLYVVPHMHHLHGWSYPLDLFNYFFVARYINIGDYQHIYGQFLGQTGLTTAPGAVVALEPVWMISHAAGMWVDLSAAPQPRPTIWPLLGSYSVLLSSSALFAADAVARHMGASRGRRLLICAGEVYILYNVLQWGHPEDAVAVALLLYSCLAAFDERWPLSSWLFGAAVAFQPFVLLAFAPVFFPAGLRRLPGLLARAVVPVAALLVVPLAMNWTVTAQSLVFQPASLSGGRLTPWIHFAPSLVHFGPMGANLVAGGPARSLGILISLVLGFWFARAERGLAPLIAVVALTLTFRCVFETVIAPYYVFPAIAFAFVSLSAASWPRFLTATLLAVVVNSASNFDRHSTWVWWPIVAGLAALVAVSWPKPLPPVSERQGSAEGRGRALPESASVVATPRR